MEPKDITPQPILTNFSLAHFNTNLIWRAVSPVIKVAKRLGFYWEQNVGDNFKLIDDSLSSSGLVNESGINFTKKAYAVESKGTGEWLPKTTEGEDEGLDVQLTITSTNKNNLDLAHEKRVADVVFAAATYPAANKVALSAGDRWDVPSTSVPLKDIQDGFLAMLTRGNLIVFGEEAWEAFRRHPQTLDAVASSTRNQGAAGGLATADEVSNLFTVSGSSPVKIVVGTAKFTVDGGATMTRVWGKHVAIIKTETNPGRRSQIFTGTISESEGETTTIFNGERGEKGSTLIKSTWNQQHVILSADVGYFIETVIS